MNFEADLVALDMPMSPALEQRGNNPNAFDDFCTKHGSSQGQNLAVTVLCVSNSLSPTTGEEIRGWPAKGVPRSNEFGTCKTVTARFWPWLSGKGRSNHLNSAGFGEIDGAVKGRAKCRVGHDI
jgi:hypothetical protein